MAVAKLATQYLPAAHAHGDLSRAPPWHQYPAWHFAPVGEVPAAPQKLPAGALHAPLQALEDSPVAEPYTPTAHACLSCDPPLHQYPIGHATPLPMAAPGGQYAPAVQVQFPAHSLERYVGAPAAVP